MVNMRYWRQQDGMVSIMAIVTMVFGTILFSGLMFALASDTTFNKVNTDTINAQYAAEAGIKRALATFQDGKTNNAVDWTWLQTDKNALKPQKLIDADSSITYSVVVQLNNASGAVVTKPSSTAGTTDITYYVTATGKVGNIKKTNSVTVTIPKSGLPPVMQYVYDTVTKAVKQTRLKNWKRESGKQYNADSWNGIAELMLQEGSATIGAGWKPKYDGTEDRVKWGSNWHYGYTSPYIAPVEDATYAPEPNDYKNFTNLAGYYTSSNTSHFNQYSDLVSSSGWSLGLWDGTPTVYSGGTNTRSDINGSGSLKPYFPPWVLLTASPSFSPTNIKKILNTYSTDNALVALKCILGTIVVYRADTPSTGDPSDNPVQIYKINLDIDTSGRYPRCTRVWMSDVSTVEFKK